MLNIYQEVKSSTPKDLLSSLSAEQISSPDTVFKDCPQNIRYAEMAIVRKNGVTDKFIIKERKEPQHWDAIGI